MSRVYMVLTLGWVNCVHDTTWTGIAHWRDRTGQRGGMRESEWEWEWEETTGSSSATAAGIQASTSVLMMRIHQTPPDPTEIILFSL